MTQIRDFCEGDGSELVALLQEYMLETYDTDWHGTEQQIARDAAEGALNVLVAQKETALIGFIAWTDHYDLHWSVRGGEVLDLFVRPQYRGHAVAIKLISAAAARVEACGGLFLKGGAVETDAVQKLYDRLAVRRENVEFSLGGRAFRTVSSMAKLNNRQLVASLPLKEWNYQA